jgi:hypothetical protein
MSDRTDPKKTTVIPLRLSEALRRLQVSRKFYERNLRPYLCEQRVGRLIFVFPDDVAAAVQAANDATGAAADGSLRSALHRRTRGEDLRDRRERAREAIESISALARQYGRRRRC